MQLLLPSSWSCAVAAVQPTWSSTARCSNSRSAVCSRVAAPQRGAALQLRSSSGAYVAASSGAYVAASSGAWSSVVAP